MEIKLTGPQFELVASEAQFPCFCGGYGSGKTNALIIRAITKKLQYPKQSIAYYLPTFDLCRVIGFPRFADQLDSMGLKYEINKSFATIDIAGCGRIIFRTLDSPERIVGFETADAFVDELDTLPIEKARDVWNKIIARNRQKKPDGSINTVAVGSTPEGFAFIYEAWKKLPKPGYHLIKASTKSNARNLPDGYIESLMEIYPSALLAAYLDGEFCNLTSGSVYAEFDRVLNASSETVQPGEALHIGEDFNVANGAAVIHVLRGDDPHAVAELTGVFDTPAMIALLKRDYQNHPIMIYPDASGQNRKSNNASESDLSLLRAAGFRVCVNASNPRVKDRVLSVNRLIHNEGVRRYRVNPQTCPQLVESLEKQAYDKHGEPDKSGGFDHVLDAAGYCIVYRYPIIKRTTSISSLRI